MRKKPELPAVFKTLPLFATCSDAELREIDSLADEVHVPAGRDIIRQGELGREFVVIVEGEASVVRDGAEVAKLGPGAHFGELALIESVPRNATVTATTDMVLEVIDRRGFQTLLDDSPHLTRNLLRATARRLSEVDQRSRDVRPES
ncbi:MAG TPA: cyclic nucleotide-binding domain-containing protein [Microthrixaceae bacterium]|nr:cyclic nucleotide-binding domain-containing protein [Microthrixaceae bacterium]